jgi:hypothetical protein
MSTIAMWLQDADSLSSGNSRLLMFFVGMVALSMLTQTIVFIAAVVAATKARNRLISIAEEVRLKTIPVIDTTLDIVEDLRPKLKVMSENFVEASHIVRAKAQEFDSTVTDVNQKTRAQAARVDDMVTSVLNTTTHIASTIQKGVQVPVTQFSGLMNGLKAGLDTLVGRGKSTPHSNHDATKPFGYGVKDDDIGL